MTRQTQQKKTPRPMTPAEERVIAADVRCAHGCPVYMVHGEDDDCRLECARRRCCAAVRALEREWAQAKKGGAK